MSGGNTPGPPQREGATPSRTHPQPGLWPGAGRKRPVFGPKPWSPSTFQPWLRPWNEKDRTCVTTHAAVISLIVSFDRLLWKKIFLLNGRKLGFFCFRRWMTITWSRDIGRWNCKQPGCGCRVMETLPRGNGWKLMTTGGAAKAQVVDS